MLTFLIMINKTSLVLGTLIGFIFVLFGGVYSLLYFKDAYKILKKEETQNEECRKHLLKIFEGNDCAMVVLFMFYSFLVSLITGILIDFLR